MGFSLSRDAEDDVLRILATGFESFGIAQAEAYHADLVRVLDLIAANPRMARLRSDARRPVRLHPFRAHVILYTEAGGEVLILRILHHRQDWLRHLT